eukprot:g74518.t1
MWTLPSLRQANLDVKDKLIMSCFRSGKKILSYACNVALKECSCRNQGISWREYAPANMDRSIFLSKVLGHVEEIEASRNYANIRARTPSIATEPRARQALDNLEKKNIRGQIPSVQTSRLSWASGPCATVRVWPGVDYGSP